MKQLLEQYSAALIAALTGLVLAVVFNGIQIEDTVGISDAFGEMLEQEIIEVPAEYGGKAFDTYNNRTKPVIIMQNAYAIEAGKWVSPEAFVTALDGNGKEIPAKILSSWDMDGNNVNLSIAEGGSFCFSNAGIYWVWANAEDVQGYERDVLFKCFVNEGRNR